MHMCSACCCSTAHYVFIEHMQSFLMGLIWKTKRDGIIPVSWLTLQNVLKCSYEPN